MGAKPAHAGFYIVQRAFDVWGAGGAAVAAVIQGEDVVAFGWQPGHVEDVAADVLGVAVEKVHGAFGGFGVLGRQPPAVQGFAVGGFQIDVFVLKVEPVRGDVGHAVGKEEHTAAPGLQESRTEQYQGCAHATSGQCVQK